MNDDETVVVERNLVHRFVRLRVAGKLYQGHITAFGVRTTADGGPPKMYLLVTTVGGFRRRFHIDDARNLSAMLREPMIDASKVEDIG